MNSPHFKIAQHSLVVGCCVLWFLSVLFFTNHTLVVLVCITTVVIWAWIPLWEYVSGPLLRRLLKFVPYFVPVVAYGIPQAGSLLAGLIPICASILYLLATRKHVRKALDKKLLSLMPRGTWQERWGETAFFSLSAIAQEYLHRFVLVVFLTEELHLNKFFVIFLTTTTFVLEHFSGPNGHTALTKANLILWLCMGLLFGAMVCSFQAYIAVMVGHLLINLPAAIRPHLRGRDF